MAILIVHCPRCQSDCAYRHGKTPAGHARYRCPARLSVSHTLSRCTRKWLGITSTAWIDYPCDKVSIRPSNLIFGNEIELKG